MSNVKNIRSWLIAKPRPTSVKIIDAEQMEHRLELVNGMTWQGMAESIHALQAERLEALDAKGKLLRATRPADTLAEEEEEEEESIEVTDVDSQRLVVFARLLADAYRHSNDVAFQKLGELFDATNRRAESLEKTVAALLRFREKQILDSNDEGGEERQSFEKELLAAIMQGKAQGELEKTVTAAAAKAVVHAATNGAPKPEEGKK